MGFFWKIGILLLLPIATLQYSTPSSLSYIGAVAEYYPVTNTINGEKPAELNAKNYVKFIKKASEYSADILVFPEFSMAIPTSPDPRIARSEAASYVPEPAAKLVLCGNDVYAKSLQTISCAARDHGMYVVVNHQEKLDCPESAAGCPEDRLLVYNTNVVFDREGRLIARYRKYNLYGEPGTNVTRHGLVSTFPTDFGVSFGQFICADIIYYQPALNLTRQLGVTDVVYPSRWFSELPFHFSLQQQAGWSYVNDVNLLSSGFNYPETSNSGSGIYAGKKGFIDVVLQTKPSNTLIVSEIPKVINGKRLLDIDRNKLHVYKFSESEIDTTKMTDDTAHVIFTEDLSIYTTKEIDFKSNVYDETVCDRGFCCDFKLKTRFEENLIENNNYYYKYRIAVLNGTRSYPTGASSGLKTCGVIACTSDSLSSCGRLFGPQANVVSPATFEIIEITARRISNENVFFIPATVTNSLLPLNVTDYIFKTEDFGLRSTHSMALTKGRSDLLTFAIFGRYYPDDYTEPTKN